MLQAYIEREVEMKVTVFGRKGTVQKLSKTLAAEGVEVTAISDGLSEMIRPDLAIVDGQVENAAEACRDIRQTRGTPVVVTVDRKQTDWVRLRQLGADHYLPAEAPDWELTARVRSVLRRFRPDEQTNGGYGL